MGEASAPVEAPAARYERFKAHYPSGVVLPCHYPGGVTLWEARVDHLYAKVTPVEESRVETPARTSHMNARLIEAAEAGP